MKGNLTLESSWRDTSVGLLVSVVSLSLFSVLLIPFRQHASLATFALVLVVPIAAGVAIGGPIVGVLSTAAGFLAYDYFFIPPYDTLSVGASTNWVALFVYGLVGFIISAVVVRFRRERARVIDLNKLLSRLAAATSTVIVESDPEKLKQSALDTMLQVFPIDGAMVVDREGNRAAGADVEQLSARLTASDGVGLISSADLAGYEVRSFPLIKQSGDYGRVVVWSRDIDQGWLPALETFVNQLCAALERTELRETQVRLATMEQADRWRTSLLRTVSHDLLTPLAGIKTALTTLIEQPSDISANDRETLLCTSLEQADRLIQLVTDLLNVTRIEAGVFRPHYDHVDLVELVHSVVKVVDFVSVNTTVKVASSSEKITAYVDRGLIREAVWNLLENAVRYSPVGGVIEVFVGSGHGEVIIQVTDYGNQQGSGLDPRAFDWFHQLGPGGRSGLGLAIVRSFVEAHGGRVEVTTDVATTFRIIIPCSPVPLAELPDDDG